MKIISMQLNVFQKRYEIISMRLNVFQKRYENFIILGDFNSEINEDAIKDFSVIYNFKSSINQPTCFKNPQSPSCIDLILTNKSMSFQNTSVIETVLSDFHKLTVTVMKMSFSKQEPKIFYYRDYKTFNDEHFRNDLKYIFNKRGVNNISCSEYITITTLNIHAPMKKKYLRANNAPYMNRANNVPYMNRALCKAIMVRSKLRNIFLKLNTIESRDACKKQRNFCVSLLRMTKKNYYENLNVVDNKTFWKSVKPFFSEKSQVNTKIILLDDEEIISDSTNCAEILNNYFSDIAINLEVDREIHTVSTNSYEPVMAAIEKYKTHPSITKIVEENFKQSNFDFHNITEVDMLKVIENLDVSKFFPEDNIPPKIIKENKDIFSIVLTNGMRKCIENCISLSILFLKNMIACQRIIIGLLASCLRSQNYTRKYYISKFTITSKTFSLNIYIYADSGRDIAHSIAYYLC